MIVIVTWLLVKRIVIITQDISTNFTMKVYFMMCLKLKLMSRGSIIVRKACVDLNVMVLKRVMMFHPEPTRSIVVGWTWDILRMMAL